MPIKKCINVISKIRKYGAYSNALVRRAFISKKIKKERIQRVLAKTRKKTNIIQKIMDFVYKLKTKNKRKIKCINGRNTIRILEKAKSKYKHFNDF